ncbi:MAG: hypothetical protein ACYTFI_05505 [Planctomycetota bacterium]|jgi:hypothetical protein
MKESAVVIRVGFTAVSFCAAVGFCLLWRSSARASRDATTRAVAAEAKVADLERTVDALEMKLATSKDRIEIVERDKKELFAANMELNQRLKDSSVSLFKVHTELRRVKEALLKERSR